MKGSVKARSKANWSEKLAWGIGVALLLSYGGARLWLDDSSEAAVASFRQMREAQELQDFEPPNESPEQVDSTSLAFERAREANLAIRAPDTTQWSIGRKQAYEQVLASDQQMPLAILRVDDLALEVPVYGSTDEWNLNRGAGWIEGTSRIGDSGNVGVAAHRDGYFRALQDVALGQKLVLETLSSTIEYRITGVRVVSPDAVEVLAPTEHDRITLVTCYPFYYVGPAPHRFIVTAERIEPQGTVVAAAMQRAGS
jgi:sortase A